MYVAFGEEPQALRSHHPEAFERLYGAWHHAYPATVAYVIVV